MHGAGRDAANIRCRAGRARRWKFHVVTSCTRWPDRGRFIDIVFSALWWRQRCIENYSRLLHNPTIFAIDICGGHMFRQNRLALGWDLEVTVLFHSNPRPTKKRIFAADKNRSERCRPSFISFGDLRVVRVPASLNEGAWFLISEEGCNPWMATSESHTAWSV